MKNISVQCGSFFRQVFPCKNYFFLEISLQDIFPEITHTLPLKSQMVGPFRRNVHPPVHPFHFQVLPFSYMNSTTRGFSFCIAQFVMAGFGKFQVETSVCLMSVRIEKINTWDSLLQ